MMNMIREQRLAWFTGAALIVLLGAIQFPLSGWTTSKPKLQQLMYIPDGQYLRMASLGYRELAADLLWLQAIQVMGRKKLSEVEGRWLYQVLDTLTTIDPKFVRAYEAGSIALCTLVVQPDASNRLLEKGILHNPQEWQLPFLLGINFYFELADDGKAAERITQAAHLPGAPNYLADLAARLYVSAKSPQRAVEFLAKAYEETSDPNLKKLLELRLKQTIVERDLQLLERVIGLYQTTHSRRPDRLEDLVGAGLLRELPHEPFGGRYLYESTTGVVRSSEVAERMRMSSRRRAL